MRSRERSPVFAGRSAWLLWVTALVALLAVACAAPTRSGRRAARPLPRSAAPAKPLPASPAPKPAAARSPALSSPSTRYVTVPLLNLRGCPGMQCTLLAVLAQNDAVVRLRENGEWMEVRLVKTGQTGWVAGRFLVDRPVAATAKPGAPAAATPAPVETAPAPAAPTAPSRPAQGGALKEEFLE